VFYRVGPSHFTPYRFFFVLAAGMRATDCHLAASAPHSHGATSRTLLIGRAPTPAFAGGKVAAEVQRGRIKAFSHRWRSVGCCGIGIGVEPSSPDRQLCCCRASSSGDSSSVAWVLCAVHRHSLRDSEERNTHASGREAHRASVERRCYAEGPPGKVRVRWSLSSGCLALSLHLLRG
jgi:hypothetical protein